MDAVPPVAVPKPRDDDNSNDTTKLLAVAAAFADNEAVINPVDDVSNERKNVGEAKFVLLVIGAPMGTCDNVPN